MYPCVRGVPARYWFRFASTLKPGCCLADAGKPRDKREARLRSIGGRLIEPRRL